MNALITSAMLFYTRMVNLSLPPTEQVTFDQLVMMTGCPEKLARFIIREMVRRHLLEASLGGCAFTEVHLAVFEALDGLKWQDKLFAVKHDWLRSIKYRFAVVATTHEHEVYWSEDFSRA